MTRYEYFIYLLKRLGEAFLVAALGFGLVLLCQNAGLLQAPNYRWVLRTFHTVHGWFNDEARFPRPGPWFAYLGWATWPALGGYLMFLFFGPKQKAPVLHKVAGIMYQYGGINTDHNSGCRGGKILGSTGCGKTQICINPRNHSLMINNGGIENKGWAGSESQKEFDGLRRDFLHSYKLIEKEINILVANRAALLEKITPIQNKIVASLLVAVRRYNKENLHATFSQPVFENMPDYLKVAFGTEHVPITPQHIISLFQWARKAQRFGDVSQLPFIPGSLGKELKLYASLITQDAEIDSAIAKLYYLLQVKQADLQRFGDTIKPMRYNTPPIGMLVLGAKGNEWQNVVPMLHHYNRDEDLCLLQTRPVGAPPDWSPPAKFNLIGYEGFPADTYAKLICDTYKAATGDTKADFFSSQAREAIANGIRLMRCIRDAQVTRRVPADQRVNPNLSTLASILMDHTLYKEWITEIGAAPYEKTVESVKPHPTTGEMTMVQEKKQIPASLLSEDLQNARDKLESTYWQLPNETRGGVMGNIRNVIGPFTEPEVAAVFCDVSTFDIGELTSGKVICVAMPQIFALQRMFVATIMKTLTLQIGLNIFDLRKDNPLYTNRNVVLIDSDEHQVSAGEEDQQVDRTREAMFTLYIATQTRSAVYMRYGGKEKAIPVLSNLRNLWACQSGNDECAEETSKEIGENNTPEYSYSSGGKTSTTTSYKVKPYFEKHVLKMLPPFHVVYAPADGKWLFKLLIVMPITPSGQTPDWWFGTWNPWFWFCWAVSMPNTLSIKRLKIKIPLCPKLIIPPWQARAPWRAQRRYLLGLDGTYIELKKMKRATAMKKAMENKD